MKPDKNSVWFPAKRYGFGWGLPNCWQGWVVLLAYLFLATAGSMLLTDSSGIRPSFVFYFIIISALFIVICWKKGEKRGWRWGDKK